MSFVIDLLTYYNYILYINGVIFSTKKITIAVRNQICIVAYKDGRHPIFGSNEQ